MVGPLVDTVGVAGAGTDGVGVLIRSNAAETPEGLGVPREGAPRVPGVKPEGRGVGAGGVGADGRDTGAGFGGDFGLGAAGARAVIVFGVGRLSPPPPRDPSSGPLVDEEGRGAFLAGAGRE